MHEKTSKGVQPISLKLLKGLRYCRARKIQFLYQRPLMHGLPDVNQCIDIAFLTVQDNNDTDADALDRVSASCIFRIERK